MFKQAKVYFKERSEYKTITITTDKPEISDNIIDLWQNIVNIVANISSFTSVIITNIQEEELTVLVSSDNLENPFNETVSYDLGHGNFCEETLGREDATYIVDAKKSEIWRSAPSYNFDLNSYYGIPLKWPDGQYFGTFSIFNIESIELTEVIVTLLDTYKNIIEAYLELLVTKESLHDVTYKDDLTGVYNRKKIKECLHHEFDIARRTNNKFTLVIFDLDRFNLINELYGYEKGDNVLKFFSDIILSRLRSTDSLGRWNNDDFIVICPNTDISGAKRLKLDTISAVENHSIKNMPELSCSAGIAEYKITDEDIYDLIKRADIDLYRDKSSK